jgi:hypothetical protein
MDMVRSGRLEPHVPLTAPSFDEEFGKDENVEHSYDEEPQRRSRSVGFWLGMAVLGVILAVVWQTSLWPDAQRWLARAAGLAAGPGNPVEEQLGRIAEELDALKKNMDEFRAAQQQTAANVTLLQANQRELQQHISSFQRAPWYADLAALTYATAAAKKAAAAASPKQMPSAPGPSEAQDPNVGSRNDGAPLSLSPRP